MGAAGRTGQCASSVGCAAAFAAHDALARLAGTRPVVAPRALEPVVHVYFHDTDLLDRRRRLLLRVALAALARRRRPASAAEAAAAVAGPEVAWADVARGRPVGNAT